MNADEMFEALGYEKVNDPVFGDWITYSQGILSAEVTFDLTFKNIILNTTLDTELYKAIGKKMEELRWLKDEL